MVRGLLALAREAAQERMAQPPPPEADTLQRLDRLAREVRDLSVFRLVTNFVRLRRLAELGGEDG